MRIFKGALTGLVLAAASVQVAPAASAQGRIPVNIGTVTSTQTCAYFRNYAGSSLRYSESEYARVWGAAAARRYYLSHTTWASWVSKDCQTNFQNLRNTLSAALASTGRLTSGTSAGEPGYTLDLTISSIGQTPPAQGRPVRGDNAYRLSWGTATVTVSYTLKDENGANVDGGVFTKKIEMSRTLDTNQLKVRTSEPGSIVYDLMQNEVALTVARDVVFELDPMRVMAVEDDLIEVNYGRPMVKLGDRLDVKKTRGIGSVRYRVTSASDRDATAEVDGDVSVDDIEPGNLVTFVESDSDAANARRYRRKRLP